MSFTQKQEAAITALERVLERFAALDLSVYVSGGVCGVHVRRGPLEVDDFGSMKQEGVEWITIAAPGLDIDGGGW